MGAASTHQRDTYRYAPHTLCLPGDATQSAWIAAANRPSGCLSATLTFRDHKGWNASQVIA